MFFILNGGNMKKLLLLLLTTISTMSYSCNLCFDFNFPRFRKTGYQQANCNCNCYQYPISKHEDKHICTQCGHRVLPWNVKSSMKVDTIIDIGPLFIDIVELQKPKKNPFKQTKLKRYNQKKKKKKTTKFILLDQL